MTTGGWCYLMVEKKSEKLGVPEGWDHIELGDFTAHSKYPTLVGEIQNGFVKIFGRRPGNRLYAGALLGQAQVSSHLAQKGGVGHTI